jgi:hypothetical protein
MLTTAFSKVEQLKPLDTCNAQAHEIVDAITAVVINAQAGLNWLSAQPTDRLDEVRKALNGIVGNGKRAGEVIVRLRALMDKVPAADES